MNLPKLLSDNIEVIQKRRIKCIFQILHRRTFYRCKIFGRSMLLPVPVYDFVAPLNLQFPQYWCYRVRKMSYLHLSTLHHIRHQLH